ncbi:MAG: endo-1,4-beta-xylanase, partial [Phycisphaerae bacterium]
GEMFNYSVISLSGHWLALEPKEGQPNYTDLDRYIEWAQAHGVRLELSFLTGYQPGWLRAKSPPERERLIVPHARALVERYGARIESWQVMSEKIGWEAAPEIFTELRKISPQIRLGIADDARFWSPRPEAARAADMYRGLEEIRMLKQRGVQVDFFAFQGHRPLGLWADSRDIYAALDAYAKENVRIHITEFGAPVGARMEGPVHNERWTPELQATYYERFFTICFSHPGVDVINVSALGAKSWIAGEGLLDEQDLLTPAGRVLKELITQRWRTNLSGTSAADGLLKFRGFQGTYELTVVLPSGKSVSSTLRVVPGGGNRYRLAVDAPGGKITLAEEH